jgi:hypothetical protein
MNWYKSRQQKDPYSDFTPSYGISLTGNGLNEIFKIPNSSISLNGRDLMNEVLSKIKPILIQNNVKEINTGRISKSDAIGLAVSSEAGIVHVDIAKILNNIKNQAMPPNYQNDGMEVDPDKAKDIRNMIGEEIKRELLNTSAHESYHMNDYFRLHKENRPFTDAQESPAENFGNQIRERYFPKSYKSKINL